MQEHNQKLLTEYLEREKQRGRRLQGLIGLRNRVPKLFVYLKQAGLALREVKAPEAREYQAWLIEGGKGNGQSYSPRTIAAYMVAAGSFYEYLKEEGLVAANPFKEVRKIRTGKSVVKHLLKEKELNALLAGLKEYDKAGNLKRQITRYKAHVLGELLYATGLRISEAAGLRTEDVDFKRGIVTVREGKGGRMRQAFLNDYAKEVLGLYVGQLREVVFSEWNRRNGKLLFGTGWGWFGKVMNREFKGVAEKLGHKGFSCHQFRHALGYHLLRAGCNIRHIQEILGHRHLRNTEIYTQVDQEDLKGVFKRCHPRKWRRRL